MEHIINLRMGDWSHDGHSQTEVVTIKSTLTSDELKEAYNKGISIIGVDLKENIASKFEDSTLNEDDYKKFKDAGLLEWKAGTDLLWVDDEDNDKIYLDHDSYCHLYLFTVFIGDNKFDYDVARDTVNIGAYGLFYI